MKNILLLLLLTLGVTSCGSWELVTTTQAVTRTSGITNPVTWQYGVYGWGYYDTFGRPIYNGFNNFNNGGFYYGPRVIIRNRGNGRSRVKVATPRGSRGTVNRGRRTKNLKSKR